MAPSHVKASVLHGARDLRLEDRPLDPLGPHDVLVAVKTTGLCGSDLHYYSHFRNGDILVREPLTLGHESAGVVTAVGSEVSTLRVGDRVALEVGQPCEKCTLCVAGRYNICPEMRFRSSAKAVPHAQGTLQEVIVHPEKWCHKLPDSVTLPEAALAEPLAVAIHAFHRASPLPPRAKVLVLGAGTVGLLCAAAARAMGDQAYVLVADVQADRVKFAVENGFADGGFVVPVSSTPPPVGGGGGGVQQQQQQQQQGIEEKLKRARELAGRIGETEIRKKVGDGDGEVERLGLVDVVFECTGVEACLQAAIYATQPGGKVLIIGMGNPVQTLPVSAAAQREVDLVGVFRYKHTYPQAIELMRLRKEAAVSHLPDVTKLITHRFRGLEEVPRAFDMAARAKDEEGRLVLKVMVEM